MSGKPSILVLSPFTSTAEAELKRRFNVQSSDDCDPTEIEAVVTGVGFPVRLDFIARLPKLRAIYTLSAGHNHIDMGAPRIEKGEVSVAFAPEPVTKDTADAAMHHIRSLVRGFGAGSNLIRDGKWTEQKPNPGQRVTGKTLGIFGLGRIGKALAIEAEREGMKVIYAGRSKKNEPYEFYSSISKLAKNCDVLALTCALNDQTQGIVDMEVLRKLGEKGYLVNIARGEIVNENDLITALKTGAIAGAGLDVFTGEPDVNPELVNLPNVSVTPHLGYQTVEARAEQEQQALDDLTGLLINDQPIPDEHLVPLPKLA